jgi:hypothetical protein
VIEILWKKDWWWKGQTGWAVPGPEKEIHYFFPDDSLRDAPRNLRGDSAKKILEQFEDLVSQNNLIRWWGPQCGGTSDKVFLLRFSEGGWDIPWELLVALIDTRESHPSICIARSTGDIKTVALSAFNSPLRTLLLRGNDGATLGPGRKLDLQGEIGRIDEAWAELEVSARQRIARPIIKPAQTSTLGALLSELKPHIIWFSGHGRSTTSTDLYFADKEWVNVTKLGDIIKQSGAPPLYGVFWACDSGRSESEIMNAPPTVSPPIFEALRSAGLLSVLAMQSPVRDRSAKVMAADLFRFLASGLPLEKAAARARANLLAEPQDKSTLDWACPVVWCAGQPVEKLEWDSPVPALAQLQLLGRQMLRWNLSSPSVLEGSTTEGEQRRAEAWFSSSLTWVRAEFVEELAGRKRLDLEHQISWVRTLQAVQRATELHVVAVELTSSRCEEDLRKWAEGVYSRIIWGDVPDEIIETLNYIKAGQVVDGWQRLCAMSNAFIAIAAPLPYMSPSWLWEPLLEEGGARFTILTDQAPPEPAADPAKTWEYDAIDAEMRAEAIESAVDRAPRLARALATLSTPLRRSRIEVLPDQLGGVMRLADWAEGEDLLVETAAGPVMVAAARRFIFAKMNEDERQLAHKDCVAMLGHPDLELTEKIRERRLYHLMKAGMPDTGVIEAGELCNLYAARERPLAVIEVMNQMGEYKLVLPQSARLAVAWAHLRLGEVGKSEYWLKNIHPHAPLEEAWKHAIKAEVNKSKGFANSKEAALAEIEAAIKLCHEAAAAGPNYAAQRMLRRYQQDRARILQYLFYANPGAVAGEYEKLIEAWREEPDAALDMATVKRNYAELLLTRDGDDLQRARDMLEDAERLSRQNPQSSILSEVLYMKAKAAELADDRTEALHALEECQKAALRSGHGMMWAIAENRRFWNYDTASHAGNFSIEKWDEIVRRLRAYPLHGWAVRTLIDGQLRVARYLESISDPAGARGRLSACDDLLRRNPSFNGGSDRFRLAATAAGQQLLSERQGADAVYWSAFLAGHTWATSWLAENSYSGPVDLWERVR